MSVHLALPDETLDYIARVIDELEAAQRALVALAAQLKDEVPAEFVPVIEAARASLAADELAVEASAKIAERVFAQVRGTIYRRTQL